MSSVDIKHRMAKEYRIQNTLYDNFHHAIQHNWPLDAAREARAGNARRKGAEKRKKVPPLTSRAKPPHGHDHCAAAMKSVDRHCCCGASRSCRPE